MKTKRADGNLVTRSAVYPMLNTHRIRIASQAVWLACMATGMDCLLSSKGGLFAVDDDYLRWVETADEVRRKGRW